MEKNSLMMQYFEWYLPNDGQHWLKLQKDVDHLHEIGVNYVWLPPFCKATSINDVGYGIYDLWDIGEFDQLGSVRTKYGNKEELLQAIQTLHQKGIHALADLVLNHKAYADGKEKFRVIKVNPDNRQETISDPYEIEAWTHFYFPGRKGKYSDFEWHWYHFSGIDYDATNDEQGIYLILGDEKGWADDQSVDNSFGNYDYLMFADIDYSHPEVREHIKNWLEWMIKETGVRGLRFDALKHIDSQYIKGLCEEIRETQGEDFYLLGEYWNPDLSNNLDYLAAVDYQIDLFDVGLHMNFFQASQAGSQYDLSKIFKGSLVEDNPLVSVTFVNNHDTQIGQPLESRIESWFMQHAYALILLRQQGIPTLFYGDYYGIQNGEKSPAYQEIIDPLLHLRKYHVYGEQVDYFDHYNTIGWTCLGTPEHPYGIAVVMTNGDEGFKEMTMGELNAGAVFVDYLNNHSEKVELDDQGVGVFPVNKTSVSVWIDQKAIWN
ncbi:alpha-amylase [Facklamia miroungae]|uniref:Alpha-amylase n=1 Tax=Facklamia miroungae TaxID=120956 RepID=A0A1G7SXU9_9LACT|nr:alpha-amylase [Facklamia miroungae]NKZ29512.1 alpha-amylase [Facklamia miroungae]SDG27249.1 alpha-amylase [Facklamia miroungae]